MKISHIVPVVFWSIFLLFGGSVKAQQDTYGWRIGGGAAVFSYYGDLSYKPYNADLLKYGYFVQAEKSLSPAWSFQAGYLYGKLEGNDRMFDRNDQLITDHDNYKRALNFMTDIHGAWASFVWYADNGGLMKEWSVVAPFLKAGVGMIWFDPKADLFNEDGLQYYYWSDNSIRSIDENAPNASQAVLLEQDGNFETELSPLRTELEKGYRKNSLYIPVSLGFKFRVSNRININLEAGFNYTFTDYLDDTGNGALRDNYESDLASYAADPAGVISGVRGDDSKWKDMFSYAGLSVHFNFGEKRHSFSSPSIYVSDWRNRLYDSALSIDLILDDSLAGSQLQEEIIQKEIRKLNIQILEESYRIDQNLKEMQTITQDSLGGKEIPVQINLKTNSYQLPRDTLQAKKEQIPVVPADTISVIIDSEKAKLPPPIPVELDSMAAEKIDTLSGSSSTRVSDSSIDTITGDQGENVAFIPFSKPVVSDTMEMPIAPPGMLSEIDTTGNSDSIQAITTQEKTGQEISDPAMKIVTDSLGLTSIPDSSGLSLSETEVKLPGDTVGITRVKIIPVEPEPEYPIPVSTDSVGQVLPTSIQQEGKPEEISATVIIPVITEAEKIEKDSIGTVVQGSKTLETNKSSSKVTDSLTLNLQIAGTTDNDARLNDEIVQLRQTMNSVQDELETMKQSIRDQAANTRQADTVINTRETRVISEAKEKPAVSSTAPVMDTEARQEIRILEDKIALLEQQLSTITRQPAYRTVVTSDTKKEDLQKQGAEVPAVSVPVTVIPGEENDSLAAIVNADSAKILLPESDTLLTDSMALKTKTTLESGGDKVKTLGDSKGSSGADRSNDMEVLLLSRQIEMLRKEAELRESAEALRRQATEMQLDELKKQVKALSALQVKPQEPTPVVAEKPLAKPISVQVFFNVNQSTLNSESRASLESIISEMKSDPGARVSITGYADKSGNAAYNKALSEKRALSVRTYLRDRGINLSRILMSAVGEDFDESEDSRLPAYYRRVDVEILGR